VAQAGATTGTTIATDGDTATGISIGIIVINPYRSILERLKASSRGLFFLPSGHEG
jgi:hypothetical protein